ncbi:MULTISPECIES: SDR family oxidoreductase [unclassified Mesorhizobium]|uniref:SDR family NAD(P)-dependent oxidoreductase n=1 Tax=unclassified Mesorhizobium TaxID=325217 RepID=UPI000FCCB2B0|nr:MULTISPECIES: SDR family oxidoreductase [unclassified Mesorhizobium]TGP21505.1 SDR family oxidoreductase [Mesorhizobium sp. M1D.F.Ca.ET.231.01.1.1]TGP28951.1 SDR family oxidoreductase [Mesorhizobium sp. M1D.F.Ca.ET.234.01.1.1]TGS43420.1 SDR family oxidoreductase [Mesorhizobium sp. M1D.F.Ca.ET.184.01.1.1]TGS59967.1 SDR family oxidoreductase [Mesorhizobium sp. M1D.F.Ca.ET.183.01.1.1]
MGMLNGLLAVVTGAGQGIGQGIAEHLAGEGASLALMGRTEKSLKETVAKAEAAGASTVSVHVGSVSDEADVERVIDEIVTRHGKIDVLVNNAGIVDQAEFLDVRYERWLEVIGTDLNGTFLMTQRAARRMKDTGGGAVINIASIDANGWDGPQSSYVAAKAGVVGFTKNAAKDLAAHNIRVNSVSPGWTHTKMIEDFVSAEALNYMLTRFERVPMRRLVRVKEVAEAVGFLASTRASGITGIDVPVDCGTLATLHLYESLPA